MVEDDLGSGPGRPVWWGRLVEGKLAQRIRDCDETELLVHSETTVCVDMSDQQEGKELELHEQERT